MTTWNHSSTSGGERWDTSSLLPQHDTAAVSEAHILSTYSSPFSRSSQKERIHEASEALSVSNVDEEGLDLDDKQSKFGIFWSTILRKIRDSGWKWEIAAMILSCGSLVSTISMLMAYDGWGADSWTFFLSLSTVVSVLSQISRASIAFTLTSAIGQTKWNSFFRSQNKLTTFDKFDAASRGPFGSVKLLADIGSRHLSRWIALGLTATVALLGYDPFLQATITVSTHVNEFPGSYEILPLTKNLTIGNDLVSKGPLQIILTPTNGSAGADDVKLSIWQSLAPPEGLSTAFYEGLRDVEKLPHNTYLPTYLPTPTMLQECPESNCTFIFDSLAVCSVCHSISEHIVKVRTPSHSELKTVDDFLSTRCANPDDCFTWGLNVDQDLQRESPLYLTNRRGYFPQDFRFMAGSGRATADRRETVHFLNASTTFIVFQFLTISHSYWYRTSAFEDDVPEAQECGLSFCLKRYNSTIQNNVLRESVLQSATWTRDEWFPGSLDIIPEPHSGFDNLKEGSDQWAHWNFLPSTTLFSPWSLQNYNSTSNLSDYEGRLTYWGPDRHELRLPLPAGWEPNDLNQDVNFAISFRTIISTISWFLKEFGQSNHENSLGFVISPEEDTLEAFKNHTAWAYPTRAHNITQYVDGISKRLSVWVRDVRQEHTEFANGTYIWSFPIIRIRTPFLILPVGTILASCIFVIWTIWDTHRLGLRAWKESSLPILIHGLTASTRERLREADRANAAAKLADKTKVKLDRNSDGSFELREIET